ncbi:MAG: hypothetical protein JWP36_771 [Paucimonas sp.]|nr:hypothetical protein [Paucimonas sp.]
MEAIRTENGDGGVRAVHLALDVMELIAHSERDLGVSEIAGALGYTKGTIFRHLQTLVKRGYLQQGGDAKYRSAARASWDGAADARPKMLLAVSEPVLRQLRDDIGETVTLAAIGRSSVSVIASLMGKASLEISIKPGSVMPLHASSHGKIALAFSRQPLLAALKLQKLERLTEHTICDWKALRNEVAQVKEQGWASSPHQMMLGVNGISVPLFDRSGDCLGALALVGSVQFLKNQPGAGQLKALRKAGEEISGLVGAIG